MNSKVTMVIRVLLGLGMFVFGLNKFVGFMPMELADDMNTLLSVLKSPYLVFIGVLEMACGLLLIIKKYVGLALTFITAIVFNASFWHLAYDDAANGVFAFVFLALALVLVNAHKSKFSGIWSE